MPDLASPPPDRDGMNARITAAVDRYLDGLPLSTPQQRIIDMTLHAGGCPSGGGQ